ncbi:DUF1266 domain-containing protein [Tenacibaculum jejuense]|uniref:DUF1266 domain-containing protein n=1 Tax=Tenacibaculum jejuense TaxID=584609 RepID=A0A238U4T1_9FLAO|nr:DUF1266 domain-containing protein [Tenacibaculum jejuense]SNR14209.1 conserved protein of unknown function [Tenacibaculum jejuense]
MKILRVITLICISSLMLGIQSCGEKKEHLEDKELSSFMLGGIYFLNGYGGVEAVTKMMNDAGYTTDKQLIEGYKEIFQFAFEKSQGSGIKRMFKSMWDVSNKKELLASINDLKTRDYKYKSWDYARIINNASMGYAASWLTKEEVKNIVQEILPLAQEKYKDWKTYYEDFNKGRIEWNTEDPQAESFEKISSTITTYTNSIYQILPLHHKE